MRPAFVIVLLVAACASAPRPVPLLVQAACTPGDVAASDAGDCRCLDVVAGCSGVAPDPARSVTGRFVCPSVDSDDVDDRGCPVRLPAEGGACEVPLLRGGLYCAWLAGDDVARRRCEGGRWTATPEDCSAVP